MRRINPVKSALSVGGVIALYHAAWSGLVAAGWAKPVLDFILQLHFLSFNYDLMPFSLSFAAGLVALTFAVGALFGLVFAMIWNWLSRESAEAAPKRSGVQARTAG